MKYFKYIFLIKKKKKTIFCYVVIAAQLSIKYASELFFSLPIVYVILFHLQTFTADCRLNCGWTCALCVSKLIFFLEIKWFLFKNKLFNDTHRKFFTIHHLIAITYCYVFFCEIFYFQKNLPISFRFRNQRFKSTVKFGKNNSQRGMSLCLHVSL